jgi:thermopsin
MQSKNLLKRYNESNLNGLTKGHLVTNISGIYGPMGVSAAQPDYKAGQPFQKLLENVSSMISSGQLKQSYVYIPNFNYINSNGVSPLYTSMPAPMGIADFGLNAAGSYTYYTPSFNGTVLLDSYSTYSPGNGGLIGSYPTASGIQFNTVLSNVTVGNMTNGVYWTQNVALLNGTSLTFIDNVWNFSSPGALLNSTGIYSGNGHAIGFYYDVGPTITISYPLRLSFYNNATVYKNHPTVFFNYSYSVSGGPAVSASYDTVMFNSTVTPVAPSFEVNGSASNPMGLLYDAELVFGGPGGGSNAMVQNLSGHSTIDYMAGSAYKPIQAAYSYGADTGETSEGVSAYWMGQTEYLSQGPSNLSGLWNTPSGEPSGYITLHSTVSPGWAFAFAGQGSLRSYAPVTSSGDLSFTVSPGTYNVVLMSNDYSQYTTSFSANKTTTFTMTSSPGLLYTPIYLNGNTQALAITTLLSSAGKISHLAITLNNSFMTLNDFHYPCFALLNVKSVTNSLLVQNLNESNNFVYLYGKAYTVKNYNEMYGFFLSSNSVIKNISLMSPHTVENIGIAGSSNVLVQNITSNVTASVLVYDSQSVQVNQLNVDGGIGLLIFNSSSVSVNNLDVNPATNGTYTYGALSELSSFISVKNVNVSVDFNGSHALGVLFLATNSSSITGMTISGNISKSVSLSAIGAGLLLSKNDAVSDVTAVNKSSGAVALFAEHITFKNIYAFRNSSATEGMLLFNSSINQVRAVNGSFGFFGIFTANISASNIYSQNSSFGCADLMGNSSNMNNITAVNKSFGAVVILGSHSDVKDVTAVNDSIAAEVYGGWESVSGISASNNSSALFLNVINSTISNINGTFSGPGHAATAGRLSLPFIYGAANNTTLKGMTETGYYLGAYIGLNYSNLQNAQFTGSDYGMVIYGHNSVVSYSNVSHGGTGVLVATMDSTFTGISTYSDNVGFNVTGSGNSITQNSIQYDTNYGVNITAGTGNYVYDNNFVDNNGSTNTYNSSHIQAYSVAGNYFNLGLTGNYWADWHSAYANGTLKPYLVSNGVYDYHPLGSAIVTGYLVTFQATGLPTGTEWFVNLTNGQSYHSTSATISFQEPNGAYNYKVSSTNRSWSPAAYTGSFTMNNASVTVSVAFNLVTYAITFTETGLSPGTNWTVSIGSVSKSSVTSSITFTEPNGTYLYAIGSVSGYTVSSNSGSAVVAGKATGISLAFTQITYTVTFTESGLPTGSSWSVTLNGVKALTTTSSIKFSEPDGIYSFSVSNTTTYFASLTSGQITVSGSNASQNVQFNHYGYLTGTVSPTGATVTVNGIVVSTNGGSFNLSEPAGTYHVVVSLKGYKTYYDNVTLSNGQTLNLPIALIKLPGNLNNNILSSLSYTYIGIGLLALIVIIAIGAMAMRRGKRRDKK